jgi:secreted PhoX family phosphatase
MNRTQAAAAAEHESPPAPPNEDLASADSRNGAGDYLGDVVREHLLRRSFLKGVGLGAGALAAPALLAPGLAEATQDPGARITFKPIAGTNADAVVVPRKYTSNVIIRWGDPLLAGGPAFDVNAQTAAAQSKQFGFNCDFVAQMPLPAWLDVGDDGQTPPFMLWLLGLRYPKLRQQATQRALLWSNHEYTSGSDMFVGYTSANPTREQVDIELQAHGASLVLIRLHEGQWEYEASSRFNRRITGFTPIALSGPVAGHPLLQTAADPTGRTVLGMLNNCGGGITPWGTILTAEENFDQYFGGRTQLTANDPAKAAFYARLPAGAGESERKWERYHPRFDVSKHPNEYARFGWVVEVDPYDPSSRPRKRTALGRFKHEAAATTLARNGRAVVYSGDDARFEYFYKFVSAGKFKARDRDGNLDLLDSGTLYVAKLNADGTGSWLPLVHGAGPLTAANGFPGQAEVLINARGAADKLAATRMDRPEDIEVSPVTGKVYVALTNNTARTVVAEDPAEVAANPRLTNRWGHILEITEDGEDNGALTFRWEVFMLCGDPALPQGTYFAGFDPSKVSPISCPDNLDFDRDGNLWIATDGAPATAGFSLRNDGIFAVPVEGAERGYVRQFLSGPLGCEVASLKLSTDERTLFAAIQHPGEGAGLPNTESSWPDGTNLPPRSAVVGVQHLAGRKIGS